MIKIFRTLKRAGHTPAAYAGLILATAVLSGCTRNQLAETAYLYLAATRMFSPLARVELSAGRTALWRIPTSARPSFGRHPASPSLKPRQPDEAEIKPFSRELAHPYSKNSVASAARRGMMAPYQLEQRLPTAN